MAPQIGPHGLKENQISHENRSTCQHSSDQEPSYFCMQAHHLCPFCSMPVWQAEKRPSPGKRSSVVKDVEGNLKKEKLFLGQYIAVDHDICSTKGRLFTSKGKTKDTNMYTGGALFVDMSSKLVENVFQQHLNTHETLKAKQDFELKCKDAGVIPLEYISDNGSTFTSKSYAAYLSNFSQIQ